MFRNKMLSVELGGPQSPIDMKPDTATLLGGNFSPNGGPNSPNMGHSSLLGNTSNNKMTSYPPNHPLSGSKHLCSICGDRASGKHYGVYRARCIPHLTFDFTVHCNSILDVMVFMMAHLIRFIQPLYTLLEGVGV
ncbi:hypothetical protein RUM44_003457 [Polyplax serrata]|uniref:Nuclear receptor domain-containing protein n=1 Tax=Polyplax serrata TaxID=468196 RepID=A0ABR1AGJ8_POLSC